MCVINTYNEKLRYVSLVLENNKYFETGYSCKVIIAGYYEKYCYEFNLDHNRLDLDLLCTDDFQTVDNHKSKRRTKGNKGRCSNQVTIRHLTLSLQGIEWTSKS